MTDAEKGQFKALGAEEDNSSPEKDVVKDVVKQEPEPTKEPAAPAVAAPALTEEKKSNGAPSPTKWNQPPQYSRVLLNPTKNPQTRI